MSEKPSSNLQTILIIGMAIAAVVGALVGSVSSVTFLKGTNILSERFGASDEERVEARIVELIEEESATIAVVERVTPAVVSVIVKKEQGRVYAGRHEQVQIGPFVIQQQRPLSDEEAKQLVEVSSGTGFFVTEDGLVLTNRHVVDEQEATFVVVSSDGTEYPATLIDMDPFQDIAVLRVEGEGFPIATLGDSERIQIGQTVIAIGNSLAEFQNTVTKGVVSGVDRRVRAGDASMTEVIERAIQTDAAINQGNSGGPLINLLGEVIGMNTAMSVQAENLGFAIPINDVKRDIEDVEAFGRIVKPYLGVRYTSVKPETPEEDINFSYEVGALIASGDQPGQSAVIKGSPAEKAGLKEGDVILAIDHQSLTKKNGLSELIMRYRPEDVVVVTYLRDGILHETSVTLEEYASN